MPAIRRLYLYTVAFVSLEVILWGLIVLARSFLNGEETVGAANSLAGGLSLILVGAPVFTLHWWLAQRGAARDVEERSARLRSTFLYGVLLATLLPMAQNLLALANRFSLDLLGLNPQQALVGGDQVASDNWIAVIMNSVIALYFFFVLRRDWQSALQGNALAEMRRIYRYLWLVYSLALAVAGSHFVLRYAVEIIPAAGRGETVLLADGLSLLVVGLSLWLFTDQWIARSLYEEGERHALTRIVVLYGLVFTGVGVALVSIGVILDVLFRLLLGHEMGLPEILGVISRPLSLGIPLGLVWFAYGRALRRDIDDLPDPLQRGGLRRLVHYALALPGLGAAFVGSFNILLILIEALVEGSPLLSAPLNTRMAGSLAALSVGLPLWGFNWRVILKEAAQPGEAGDHARRSSVRKGFLFLALFAGVMGVMSSTFLLLQLALSAWLGERPERLALETAQGSASLVLFAVLAGYHWLVLRKDVRQAERSLAKRHTQFPVLILAPEDEAFARAFVEALRRQAPDLPVAVHPIKSGVPDETLSAAKAVIVPMELVAKPPEGLRLWLQSFSGARLVVPTPLDGWHWIPDPHGSLPSLASKTAAMARRMAEGVKVDQPRDSSTWLIVVYVLAGLFTLQLLILFVTLLISLVTG